MEECEKWGVVVYVKGWCGVIRVLFIWWFRWDIF